jgi:hypothetical protein
MQSGMGPSQDDLYRVSYQLGHNGSLSDHVCGLFLLLSNKHSSSASTSPRRTTTSPTPPSKTISVKATSALLVQEHPPIPVTPILSTRPPARQTTSPCSSGTIPHPTTTPCSVPRHRRWPRISRKRCTQQVLSVA